MVFFSFSFFISHQICLQSEFYFFVIPLSLLKGECVFLWEESEENRNVNDVKQKTSSLINIYNPHVFMPNVS